MKILLINKFLYPQGGDAIATLNTGSLLKNNGHEVMYWGMKHPSNPPYAYDNYFVDNIDYEKPENIAHRLKTSCKILYSLEAKSKIEKLVITEKPDIVHLNNFAHQISPSILDVFKKYKIPAIMTMHDYKLVCPSYSMLSAGKPCERCRDGGYYRCFLNKCTKKSYAKSLINTAEMYLHHNVLQIYDSVRIFIAPSMFMKSKLKEMGFKGKVIYLPNFISSGDFIPSYDWLETSIVYLGRLSREKGLFTLVEAMKNVSGVNLKIIGKGPLKERLECEVRDKGLTNIKFLGYMRREELKKEIRKSMFMVLPSECYENNPISLMEGFALGKPVIGARIGGIPELVKDNETGLTFESGNAADLRSKIECLVNSPEKIVEMGKNARTFVERELNSEKYYERLIEIYNTAIKKKLQSSV